MLQRSAVAQAVPGVRHTLAGGPRRRTQDGTFEARRGARVRTVAQAVPRLARELGVRGGPAVPAVARGVFKLTRRGLREHDRGGEAARADARARPRVSKRKQTPRREQGVVVRFRDDETRVERRETSPSSEVCIKRSRGLFLLHPNHRQPRRDGHRVGQTASASQPGDARQPLLRASRPRSRIRRSPQRSPRSRARPPCVPTRPPRRARLRSPRRGRPSRRGRACRPRTNLPLIRGRLSAHTLRLWYRIVLLKLRFLRFSFHRRRRSKREGGASDAPFAKCSIGSGGPEKNITPPPGARMPPGPAPGGARPHGRTAGGRGRHAVRARRRARFRVGIALMPPCPPYAAACPPIPAPDFKGSKGPGAPMRCTRACCMARARASASSRACARGIRRPPRCRRRGTPHSRHPGSGPPAHGATWKGIFYTERFRRLAPRPRGRP